MDQIVQRVRRFDRFTLDLMRGCLRGPDDSEIELRPKVFEVLCYLSQHAGRLIPKQELVDAVWPNVAVSDDSIVQCIRELREKLGDTERVLIKTVARRGYMLDAKVEAPESARPPDEPALRAENAAAVPQPARAGSRRQISARLAGLARAPLAWGSAAALACLVIVVGVLHGRSQGLFTWPAAIGRNASPPASTPTAFRDCNICPEMVALPAGEFMMGSSKDEAGRIDVEGLPRRVTIARPIAIGRFEVTVDQFQAFLDDTDTPAGTNCRRVLATAAMTWGPSQESFRTPGYDVSGSHPVGCISWLDAQAYVNWLRRRTGKPYRVPSEAEWEYAARAGTQTPFSFGDDPAQLCAHGRISDLSSPFAWRGTCRSDVEGYGPFEVGKLKPNPWGLFDMHGNVWEWVEDCWSADAQQIPADGTALMSPGRCETGVIRGGSFASGASRVRSAIRVAMQPARRDNHVGFRVVLTLEE
jgi:formylglycine-generating enzyme required for sulfatase activity